MFSKQTLIAIVGPTAVGKTAAGIELANHFNGEIVCVDSLLVYRDFDIGTAKPDREERAALPHHLIDIADPADAFTAGDFRRAAEAKISEIQERGKQVFLVGGSGFYLKALEFGMFDVMPAASGVKMDLMRRLEQEGKASLYRELEVVDPDAAAKIHPHDGYRIVRAMEIYRQTGKRVSEIGRAHPAETKWEIVKIGLDLPRPLLHERIEKRTALILENGLVDEVKRLKERYSLNCRPFGSVGYKETLLFLKGELSEIMLEEKIVQQTRALARRQLTWFGADKTIQWFQPDQLSEIKFYLEKQSSCYT